MSTKTKGSSKLRAIKKNKSNFTPTEIIREIEQAAVTGKPDYVDEKHYFVKFEDYMRECAAQTDTDPISDDFIKKYCSENPDHFDKADQKTLIRLSITLRTIHAPTPDESPAEIDPAKKRFIKKLDQTIKQTSRHTLAKRGKGDLNSVIGLLDIGEHPTKANRITAFDLPPAIAFDTFWNVVETNKGTHKALRILLRFGEHPIVRLAYTCSGSRMPVDPIQVKSGKLMWRHSHLAEAKGNRELGSKWPEDFLCEREKRLVHYVMQNLRGALEIAAEQIVREGLMYDLLSDDEYDELVKARNSENAQAMGKRFGIYSRRGQHDNKRPPSPGILNAKHEKLKVKWRQKILDGAIAIIVDQEKSIALELFNITNLAKRLNCSTPTIKKWITECWLDKDGLEKAATEAYRSHQHK